MSENIDNIISKLIAPFPAVSLTEKAINQLVEHRVNKLSDEEYEVCFYKQ
jgi:hypothetical protein